MTRGATTFCFDDGYQAVYDRVLPLLRQYQVPAVFAVPVDTTTLKRTEGAPVVPLEAWKRACAADGHELAAHGVTHRALPELGDTTLADELQRAQAATGATTLVYPGGAHDDRVVSAARRHYRAARTVLPGYNTLPPRDPFRLRSFVATRENFQVWKWNLRALWAWATNQWMIETYHNVSTGSRQQAAGSRNDGSRHTVPLDALQRHLRFLKRLPIRVATIRDVVHA